MEAADWSEEPWSELRPLSVSLLRVEEERGKLLLRLGNYRGSSVRLLFIDLFLGSSLEFLLLFVLLVVVARDRMVHCIVEQVHDDVRERLHLVVRPAVVRDDLQPRKKRGRKELVLTLLYYFR